MTCIAGVALNGITSLSADSMGSSAGAFQNFQTPKLITTAVKTSNGQTQVVIGYCESYRVGDLLKYNWDLPDLYAQGVNEWLVTKCIPSLRTVLSDGGVAVRNNEQEKGGEFLIGIAGRLFTVQDDYSVIEAMDSYTAIGSGAANALGAMHAISRATTMAPGEISRVGVRAAIAHCTTVGGEVHTITTQAD